MPVMNILDRVVGWCFWWWFGVLFDVGCWCCVLWVLWEFYLFVCLLFWWNLSTYVTCLSDF